MVGESDAYGLVTSPRCVEYDWKIDPLLIQDDRCFGDKGDVEDITEGTFLELISTCPSVLDRAN